MKLVEDQNLTRRQKEHKTILGAYLIALIGLLVLGVIIVFLVISFLAKPN